MEFDYTKPLGESLELYMSTDLDAICNELSLHGIVYESQFRKLWSMVCKKNAYELTDIFSKKIRRCIWVAYDNYTCNFVFYDRDKYSNDEAIRLSREYQTKKYECL